MPAAGSGQFNGRKQLRAADSGLGTRYSVRIELQRGSAARTEGGCSVRTQVTRTRFSHDRWLARAEIERGFVRVVRAATELDVVYRDQTTEGRELS